jgi:hypothetical protein
MVISCSICSIWSVVDASVSKPGITIDAGSGFGFHRGGFGVMGSEDIGTNSADNILNFVVCDC